MRWCTTAQYHPPLQRPEKSIMTCVCYLCAGSSSKRPVSSAVAARSKKKSVVAAQVSQGPLCAEEANEPKLVYMGYWPLEAIMTSLCFLRDANVIFTNSHP